MKGNQIVVAVTILKDEHELSAVSVHVPFETRTVRLRDVQDAAQRAAALAIETLETFLPTEKRT